MIGVLAALCQELVPKTRHVLVLVSLIMSRMPYLPDAVSVKMLPMK